VVDDGGAGVVFQTGFDDASECPGWTVTGGTRTVDAEGRTAPGSCRVCAANNGAGTPVDMAITKTIAVTAAGSYTAEAWAKRPGVAASPATFELKLTKGGGTVSSGRSIASTSWTSNSVTMSAAMNDGLTISVGSPKAGPGDCILVDDVVLRLK